VCERLTARRAGMTPPPAAVDAVLEIVTTEASAFGALPAPIRGETRERVTARLVELDRLMIGAVRAHADPALLQALRAEAVLQLQPFRDRMALESAVDRLLRECEKLPTVAFE
jgi:hypothetical protein